MLANFVAVRMNKMMHDDGVGINDRRCRVKKVLETLGKSGIFDVTRDIINEGEEGVEFEKEAASESRATDEFTREARIRHKQIELGIKPEVIQKVSIKKEDSRLHRAVLMNDAVAVTLFLEQGDDSKVKDSNGETPYAVAVGEENVALIKVFNDKGIDI